MRREKGTQLISTSPNATTEGSHLIWTLGKLSAGVDAIREYTETKSVWVELTGATRDPFTLG